MTNPENDIVRSFMNGVAELDPTMPRDRLMRLEWSIRQQYGGRCFYVRKTAAGRSESLRRDDLGSG